MHVGPAKECFFGIPPFRGDIFLSSFYKVAQMY